jgi:hypothetical protein
MMFFDTCPHIIQQLTDLVRATNNPEDVDTDQEDHAYDALKYTNSSQPKVKKQQDQRPALAGYRYY